MRDDTITPRGLRAAIALVAAEAGDVDMTQDELLDGVPAEEALAAMTVLASATFPRALSLPHLGTAVARLADGETGGGC